MKRIDIHYGGELYSIGQASLDDVSAQVLAALEAGYGWLSVNDGEGAPRPAHLLITPGVPIALIPIPEPSSDVLGAAEAAEPFSPT